ncbi:MAG: ornithine--oxo-acid transaminase [Ottowia sp.]|nr:ornithine--oxo-acid transaminase [Ottowia sp.]
MDHSLELEQQYCARNYSLHPLTLVRGEGVWLYDTEGRRYLDMMSAYSAVSFGHGHPRLLAALVEQAQRLALVSRAFRHEGLGSFAQRLCTMIKMDRVLPMNTGAEAVETAIKAVRKWGYKVKGIARNRAKIIVCANNFHGRTTTIVGFSSQAQYRDDFGPFDNGFISVPFGDIAALRAAMTPDVVGFLVEPVQGEGGIVVPAPGYLAQAAALCRQNKVMFIADEVQTGLGRTGKLLACWHEDVQPDGVTLGKALGGGLLPVSAFAACAELMDVFTPGDHGSTFGGNALACHVGEEVLKLLESEQLCEHAYRLGNDLQMQLKALAAPEFIEVRGLGLLQAIVLDPQHWQARDFCAALCARGVLTKDTHGNVVRLSPPLTISEAHIKTVVEAVADILREGRQTQKRANMTASA